MKSCLFLVILIHILILLLPTVIKEGEVKGSSRLKIRQIKRLLPKVIPHSNSKSNTKKSVQKNGKLTWEKLSFTSSNSTDYHLKENFELSSLTIAEKDKTKEEILLASRHLSRFGTFQCSFSIGTKGFEPIDCSNFNVRNILKKFINKRAKRLNTIFHLSHRYQTKPLPLLEWSSRNNTYFVMTSYGKGKGVINRGTYYTGEALRFITNPIFYFLSD